MRILFYISKIFGVIWFCFSCSNNNESSKEKKEELPVIKRYTYQPLRTTYPSESFIEVLDSSKWVLKSFNILPSEKLSFDRGTKDSLFFHRTSKRQQDDIYEIKPTEGLIYKNDKKIGTIFMEKIEFESDTTYSGMKLGTRFRTILFFDQSKDSIMIGAFNIGFHKNDRLFITQLRIDNKTKKKEDIELIFYKVK